MTKEFLETQNSKELAKVIIVGLLACLLLFGFSWTQLVAYYASPVVYAVAITFVAPLTSLYLDYKNSSLGDRVTILNKKKLVAISVTACTAGVILTLVPFIAANLSFTILSNGLMIALMIVIPMMSLYFDYHKTLPSNRSEKVPSIMVPVLIGVAGTFGITFAYYQNFMLVDSLYLLLGIAAVVVFVIPLISLFFDRKNSLSGKNKRPSQAKAAVTIGVGFLVVFTIVATAFLHLSLYL